MTPTQRTYKDVETGDVFRLYSDQTTGSFKLISDPTDDPMAMAGGTEVNGFYICSHSGAAIKINGKRIVKVPQGSFYNLKEGEQATHQKYTGLNQFRKI